MLEIAGCAGEGKTRKKGKLGQGAIPNKKFTEYNQSHPAQLSLFQFLEKTAEFLTDCEKIRFSQTIELYDALPKYVWDGRRGKGNDPSVHLKPIIREFTCGGRNYTLVIASAALTDVRTHQTKYYYPSRREMIVEEVLRKIAVSGDKSIFLDNLVGMKFTLYKVKEEMAKFGHKINSKDIKKSLDILSHTRMDLYEGWGKDTYNQVTFSPIENIGYKNKNDETETFVVFSPFVAKSIMATSFRLYNYEQVMSYRSSISRQLHKRMAHYFPQASLTNEYSFFVTTLVRDLGLALQPRIEASMRIVRESLEELKTGFFPLRKEKAESAADFEMRKREYEKAERRKFNYPPILLDYKIETVMDGKRANKIVDYMIRLKSSNYFIGEVIKANRLEKENKSKINIVR